MIKAVSRRRKLIGQDLQHQNIHNPMNRCEYVVGIEYQQISKGRNKGKEYRMLKEYISLQEENKGHECYSFLLYNSIIINKFSKKLRKLNFA